jgi:hypothetical protein
MRSKTLVALAVAAIASTAAATYFAIVDQRLSLSDPTTGKPLFANLAGRLNDVASVTFARKDGTLTLVRTPPGWRLVEKGNYSAAFDRLRKFLVDLSESKTVEAKTSSPAVYGSLDVDDLSVPDAKGVLLTLKDSGGTTIASLVIGKARTGRGGPSSDTTYVRRAGEAQAWLVSGRLAPEKDADRWLDRRVVDVSRERVREVAVTLADGTKLVVRRDKPADLDFAVDDAADDRAVKSPYERNAVGGAWEMVELDDVRPLGDFKFADDAAQAEARTFDGIVLRTRFAEIDGKPWIHLSARFEAPGELPTGEALGAAKLKNAEDAAKEVADINSRLAAWLYRVPDYKLEPMRRKLDDLFEPAAKTQ